VAVIQSGVTWVVAMYVERVCETDNVSSIREVEGVREAVQMGEQPLVAGSKELNPVDKPSREYIC